MNLNKALDRIIYRDISLWGNLGKIVIQSRKKAMHKLRIKIRKCKAQLELLQKEEREYQLARKLK